MVWLTIETPFRATCLVTVMVMGTRGGGVSPVVPHAASCPGILVPPSLHLPC